MNTYGELKTEVADLLNRADIDDNISSFVRKAETEIYRGLRSPDNEFVAIYNNAGWSIEGFDVHVLSDSIHLLLPPNYREMTLVTWNGKPLKVCSKSKLQVFLASQCFTEPEFFAYSGQRIAFAASPLSNPADWDDGMELRYTYYGTESLNALPTWQVATNPVENPPVEDTAPQDLTQSDDNTTRLLQRCPDVYLFGCAYYGAIHLQSNEDIVKYGGLFKEAVREMKAEAKRARYSGSTSQIASAYEV